MKHIKAPYAKGLFSNLKAWFILPALLLAFPFSTLSQQKVAHIELTFSDQDTVKIITANAHEKIGDSLGAPLEYIDLLFFVKRSFSLLPIGGVFNTTDEKGQVSIEFPLDLPGDTEGNVELIVKLEDVEGFKDTTLRRTLQWGVPIELNPVEEKRSLWAARANAPLSLVLLVNSIILIVWGLIFYICYQLYLIYKE